MPIFTTSASSLILNNTVLTHGLYSAAVEVRFAGATGVEVLANLLDAPVVARDTATPLEADNIETALPSWFVDSAAGDLHLLPAASAAIDQVTRNADCLDDFDARDRPPAAGLADIGGDEVDGAIFVDGFEAGSTSAWSVTTALS